MCLHAILLCVIRARGTGGVSKTLRSYVIAGAILLAIVGLLFFLSLILEMHRQNNLIKTSLNSNVTVVPALIGGILLLASIAECWCLAPSVKKMWKDSVLIENAEDAEAASKDREEQENRIVQEELEKRPDSRVLQDFSDTDPPSGVSGVDHTESHL